MKNSGRKIILGGIISVTVAFVGYCIFKSGGSSELADLKAELRAKGEKLTFEELGPSHSTNGTESTRQFMHAAAGLRNQVGSPFEIEVMDYVAPGTARVAWSRDNPPFISTATTWHQSELQIEEAQPEVLKLRKVLKELDLNRGWDQVDVFNRPMDDFVLRRFAAKWMAGAAMTELHRGRLEEAAEYLHSLAAMTRLQQEELTLANQMMRCAIGGASLATTWEALQTNGWNDEQLARMQSDCKEMNYFGAFEKGLIGERACFLQLIESMEDDACQRTNAAPGFPYGSRGAGFLFSLLHNTDRDELFYLEQIQATLDGVRALEAKEPWADVRSKLQASRSEFDKIAGSIRKYRYLLSLIVIPNMNKGLESILFNQTLREMTIAVIALKRYQLRHEYSARTLEDLVPEFLDELPHDYLGGRALTCRLNADGSFVLYSVGLNETDDGGAAAFEEPMTRLGIWEGLDAIWPNPVFDENEVNAEIHEPD